MPLLSKVLSQIIPELHDKKSALLPKTSEVLKNLGGLQSRMEGRYSEVELLCGRSLAILINVLGENHPHTKTAQDNFRYLVRQAVESGRAGELSDHPLTQAVLREMGA